MAQYVEFRTPDGTVLIEVDEREVRTTSGITKTGLREVAGKAVVEAQEIFQNAVSKAIHLNVAAFYEAVTSLPNPPTDVELTFGIKATGELGNVAISKLSAEGNYSVKLVWKLVNSQRTT